jgi:hypothetical protein
VIRSLPGRVGTVSVPPHRGPRPGQRHVRRGALGRWAIIVALKSQLPSNCGVRGLSGGDLNFDKRPLATRPTGDSERRPGGRRKSMRGAARRRHPLAASGSLRGLALIVGDAGRVAPCCSFGSRRDEDATLGSNRKDNRRRHINQWLARCERRLGNRTQSSLGAHRLTFSSHGTEVALRARYPHPLASPQNDVAVGLAGPAHEGEAIQFRPA